MTDDKKKGDRRQWEREGVGGDKKQDNSNRSASRNDSDSRTGDQNSQTGKRR